MSLVGLIVVIIVFALIFYLVTLLPDPPIGAPFKQIIQILVILALIIWLLNAFGILGMGDVRLR